MQFFDCWNCSSSSEIFPCCPVLLLFLLKILDTLREHRLRLLMRTLKLSEILRVPQCGHIFVDILFNEPAKNHSVSQRSRSFYGIRSNVPRLSSGSSCSHNEEKYAESGDGCEKSDDACWWNIEAERRKSGLSVTAPSITLVFSVSVFSYNPRHSV